MKMCTKDDIVEQLRRMNAPVGSVVLMHSSLRAIGPVEGGAEQLLDTLIQYFTQAGGLFCIPTHTWHNICEDITLDMTSDDQCLGALSKVALNDGRGFRSESPILSMVVFGDEKRAKAFIQDEPFITTTAAPESCYGKLYSENGYVLLAGVAHDRNTYLHAVEEILGIQNRLASKPSHVTVRRESGDIVHRWVKMFHADFIPTIALRYPKFELPFRYHGCITDGFIGNAPAQLCSAKKMKETMELIYKNSNGEDPLREEESFAPILYCGK